MGRNAHDIDSVYVEIDRSRQMRDSAERLKDLYEPGGDLTEWTALDAEEFLDYGETPNQ